MRLVLFSGVLLQATADIMVARVTYLHPLDKATLNAIDLCANACMANSSCNHAYYVFASASCTPHAPEMRLDANGVDAYTYSYRVPWPKESCPLNLAYDEATDKLVDDTGTSVKVGELAVDKEDPPKTTTPKKPTKSHAADCSGNFVVPMIPTCPPSIPCAACKDLRMNKISDWGWGCGTWYPLTDLTKQDADMNWSTVSQVNETHAELYHDKSIVEVGPDDRFSCPQRRP